MEQTGRSHSMVLWREALCIRLKGRPVTVGVVAMSIRPDVWEDGGDEFGCAVVASPAWPTKQTSRTDTMLNLAFWKPVTIRLLARLHRLPDTCSELRYDTASTATARTDFFYGTDKD